MLIDNLLLVAKPYLEDSDCFEQLVAVSERPEMASADGPQAESASS